MEDQMATQTRSVSKIAMAVAVGVLGIAAIAAGLVGSRASYKPDLIIRDLSYHNDDDIQKISVVYQNIGKASVTKPFNIAIRFDNDEINTIILDNDADVIEDQMVSETSPGSHVFVIPVEDYTLAKGEYGVVDMILMSFQELPEELYIDVMVDYGKEISELNEKNNTESFVINGEDLILYQPPVGYGYGYGYGYGSEIEDGDLVILPHPTAGGLTSYDTDQAIGHGLIKVSETEDVCIENVELAIMSTPEDAISAAGIDIVNVYMDGNVMGQDTPIFVQVGGSPALMATISFDENICIPAGTVKDMYIVTNVLSTSGIDTIHAEILTYEYQGKDSGTSGFGVGPIFLGMYETVE